jgi:hypothetical protein
MFGNIYLLFCFNPLEEENHNAVIIVICKRENKPFPKEFGYLLNDKIA